MTVRLPLVFLFMAGIAQAKGPVTNDVDRVLSQYRAAKAVQAKIKKTVQQELMGTSNTSEGQFYFSKGKLRLDIEQPEKSVLVYDGKLIWLESRLDEQNIQVSRIKAGHLKRTDSLLAALFDRKDVLKSFKLLKSHEEGGLKIFAFEPLDKKNTELRFLELALKDKDIARITYKDQMENTVSFEFRDFSRKNVPVSKFNYRPPKGASVTNL